MQMNKGEYVRMHHVTGIKKNMDLSATMSRVCDVLADMPPMHWELHEKFVNNYDLSDYDAEIIAGERDFALYFESCCGRRILGLQNMDPCSNYSIVDASFSRHNLNWICKFA